MTDESLLFAKDVNPGMVKLLFKPVKILSLKMANDSMTFKEGKDFTVDYEKGLLKLTKNTRIKSHLLYGDKVEKHGRYKNRKGQFILFSEAAYFHSIQLTVSYTHSGDSWDGKAFIPQSQDKKLALSRLKINNKKQCRIVLLGDSISVGYNASSFVKAKPHKLAFGEQVVDRLKRDHSADIDYLNVSRGGATMGWGLGNVPKVNSHNPDLVFVAFGMNDARRGGGSDRYKATCQKIIKALRTHNPKVEIVLVANMLPNEEFSPHKFHFANKAKLEELANEYKAVVVADVMSVTEEILKTKKFADICGNNLNHPNDFIHRIYADVILGVMGYK